MTTHFIDCNAVHIAPNRQRREHDPVKHQELKTSIEYGQAGLQNAIVLRLDGDHYTLVSGERRLRAVKEIWELGGSFKYAGEPVIPGLIPYTPIGELSELDAEEAELDENTRRSDLSWQEHAAAVARLSQLRDKQAALSGKPAPTLADLTAEIGASPSHTSALVKLARNLDDPDVKAATSVKEAMKIIKRKDEKRVNEARAVAVGSTYNTASHRLVLGDAGEWLAANSTPQFDIILSDPIYGMGADEFGDSGGSTGGAHFYSDSYETWKALMPRLLSGATAACKPSAHAYLFCDIERFPELKQLMTVLGWEVFRTPLIWFKPAAFRAPWPDAGPQRKYETILYAKRGGMKCQKLRGDVLTFPPDENLGHNAQKPVALFQDLLERSALPGMSVLDFSCGSGPIFPAAHALKLFATGLEIDPAAYGIAAKRIEELG